MALVWTTFFATLFGSYSTLKERDAFKRLSLTRYKNFERKQKVIAKVSPVDQSYDYSVTYWGILIGRGSTGHYYCLQKVHRNSIAVAYLLANQMCQIFNII